MGRVYSASFSGIAVTGVQDLLSLTGASGIICEILGVRVGQDSEFGDAAAEMLRIRIVRYGTIGSGGSAVTEEEHELGGNAAAAAVIRNNTTPGTTETVIVEDVFNVQSGWLYAPVPEERIIVPPTGTIVLAVKLQTAPDDSTDMSGMITWQEVG